MEKTSTRGAAGFATLLVTGPRQTGQQNLRNLENRLRLESQRIVSSIGRPLKCVFEVVVYRIALPPPLNSLTTKVQSYFITRCSFSKTSSPNHPGRPRDSGAIESQRDRGAEQDEAAQHFADQDRHYCDVEQSRCGHCLGDF